MTRAGAVAKRINGPPQAMAPTATTSTTIGGMGARRLGEVRVSEENAEDMMWICPKAPGIARVHLEGPEQEA